MAVTAPTSRDDGLVARAIAGDRDAFGALIRRHDARLRSVASKLLGGDVHRMDDVMQDAYVKAYRSLASFRGDAAFGTWIHRIVHNTCMDELRRSVRLATPVDVMDDTVASSWIGPEQATTTADSVRRALDALSADQRAAVVLVDGQGFDIASAAEILGVPEGTVGSRLSRARATLRHLLREDQS